MPTVRRESRAMSERIRRALRLVGRFGVHHPFLLLACAVLGAVPGIVWRWSAYAEATDARAFATAQAVGALWSCLLAPWFASLLTPAALRDAGRPLALGPGQWAFRSLSALVTGFVATVAVLGATALFVLPGLVMLAKVQQAPCAAIDGDAPWMAFGESFARAEGRTVEYSGLIYAVGHLSSVFAIYSLTVPMLLAYGGWLASLEILQPIDVPPAALHAVLDGTLLSISHLPLAVLAAVLYADHDSESEATEAE